MDERAIEEYLSELGRLQGAAERIIDFVNDHGEIGPEDVTWAHVGTVAAAAKKLEDIVDMILIRGEYAK